MRALFLGSLLAVAGVPAIAAPDLAAPHLAVSVKAIAAIRSSTGASHAPDGKRATFISNASGSPQVWVLNGGAPVQVTTLNDPVQSVSWSPAGDWLAYEVAPGGGLNVQVHVMRPDGSDDRLVTVGGASNNQFFGWTQDGRTLRIASAAADPSRFQTQLIEVASGKVQDVGKPASRQGLPVVSADGRFAVIERLVTRGDSNVWLIDLATGAEQLVTPHDGRAQFAVAGLSPDGRRLWLAGNAAQDNYALGVVDIDAAGKAGPMRTVLARPDAELEGLTLSDDGKTLALVWNKGGRGELGWYDTATGTARSAGALPVDQVGGLNFAPDGQSLVFTGSGAAAPADLYRIGVADNALTRLTNSAHDGVELTTLVRPRLVEWQARDGVKLSGWHYAPKAAKGPQPMVFLYHGGPDKAMLASISPLNKIGVVTTPLLVLHGANDTNVPVIEAEQIVASLKGRGVPVAYILFPDEGHGWRKLPNRVRSTTAIVDFFKAKLG